MAVNSTAPVALVTPVTDVALVETPGGTQLPVVMRTEEIRALEYLTDAQIAEARQIAAQMDPSDPQKLLEIAIPEQKELGRSAQQMLEHVRNQDTGETGKLINELVDELDRIDPNTLAQAAESWLANVPFFGRWLVSHFGRLKAFLHQYELVNSQLLGIQERLKAHRLRLLEGLISMKRMYIDRMTLLDVMLKHIGAGELKLIELRQQYEQRRAAYKSGDLKETEALQEIDQSIKRLERRVDSWRGTALAALQAARMVAISRDGAEKLAEAIQDGILNTLPNWHIQAAIAVFLFDQKKALGALRALRLKTNELMLQNAALLRMGQVEIAKEAEEPAIKIETFRKVHDQLRSTAREIRTIEETGRRERASRAVEIQQIMVETMGDMLQPPGATQPVVTSAL